MFSPAPLRFALSLVFCAAAATAPLVGAELRVGRARVIITPPVGSVMGNSYGVQISTGVSSDLYAKSVVFEIDGAKAAIVACDLISLHQPIVTRARALIAERTGVAPDRVIMAATHCHAGPQTHPPLYNLGPDDARKLNEDYVEKLPGMIADSVRLAEADLQPARMSVGRGHEDSISFNRRYLLRNGTVTMGARAADVVRRMGPIDPEVGVIYLEATDGTPLATVVNFALHVAIVTGTKTSADYPHTLAETLRRVKGDGMLTVFLNGMSGNINHVDALFSGRRLSGEAEAARVGTILAAAVLKTYRTMQRIEPSLFRAMSRPVRVPVPQLAPTAEQIERAKSVLSRWGQGAPFNEVIQAWRTLDLAEYGRDGFWNSEVQAITFGRELALVGYPGDSFTELGLYIKQNSPYAFTFVSEQSGNGSISYVPNEKAFPEKAYEVESARVAPGGGEIMAVAASRMLTELFPRP